MYRLVVSYHHPEDPQAFLAHYRTTHAPLAARMPGLAKYTWGACEAPDGSRPEYFAVAVLDFPDKDTALSSMGSELGRQGTADMASFAQAGVTITAYETAD